jgi:hypothetical protein
VSFNFSSSVDPEKPLDSNDPPPKDWRLINNYDEIKARQGFPPHLFVLCEMWQKREVERVSLKEKTLIQS